MEFNKTSSIILLFISFIAFSGCEETVELDIDFQSRYVISSYFNSDSPWAVEISTSSNSLDPGSQIELIDDARITIYDQNYEELYELYHQENGIYSNEDKSPTAGRGYHIKVERGADVLTAYSYVPENSKLKINNFTIVQEDKDEGIEVDFQIEDNSDLEAYFIWEIVEIEKEEDGSSVVNGDKLSDILINNLNSESPISETDKIEIISVGSYGNGTYSTIYSSLKGRNGNRSFGDAVTTYNTGKDFIAETQVGVGSDDSIFEYDPTGDGEDGDPNVVGGSTTTPDSVFELRVVSISRELYEHYNSVEASDGVVNGSNNKQFPIYTNVDNGIGIFAGFNESVIRF